VIFTLSCSSNKVINLYPDANKIVFDGINFDWLIGNWKRLNESPGKETYEHWQKINDKLYMGVGCTLMAGDTVWQESMKFEKQFDIWNLKVIQKDDSQATIFRVINFDSNSFTCENNLNEFPKKIYYFKKGDALKAIISGGDMAIPFDFERIE
jgi:hypothetical protein